MTKATPKIDIVIPTYQRGEVLLATIDALRLQANAYQVLHIVDQTQYPLNDATAQRLKTLHARGDINWLKLDLASIPNAMNQGLIVSTADFVLFLDDDIEPSDALIKSHAEAMTSLIAQGKHCVACVGQILQPNEEPITINNTNNPTNFGKGFTVDFDFPFNSTSVRSIKNCMAGNLLVDRQAAIACGGFDTNFVGVAYRFETEFCRRLIMHSGGEFYFSPLASLRHLKVQRGGTRSQVVNFLKSPRPDHSTGEYYFILRHTIGIVRWRFLATRFLGSINAKFYVLKPWWIPVRLIGELRGFLNAWQYASKPAKLIQSTSLHESLHK